VALAGPGRAYRSVCHGAVSPGVTGGVCWGGARTHLRFFRLRMLRRS
jgi:hypothetical protein